MKYLKTGAAALATAALLASPAFAADPTGSLDRSFTEYTGTGPVGDNNVNDTGHFYWMFESSGVFEGQAVDSWFLFYDPKGKKEVRGTVSFDKPIVYIADDQKELKATASFGKAGVTYDYSKKAVGIEANDRADTSFAGSVLSLYWTGGNPGDHIRVLTAVPEPSTYAMFGAGLVGICFLLRRRRQD